MALHDRHVDVAHAFFLVAHVSLVLEDAQLGANRGIAWRPGQVLHDLRGRGAAAAEEDVHDLPLASRERAVERVGHVMYLALVL